MVSKLKEMEGTEFISKVLSGERDFSGIKLGDRLNYWFSDDKDYADLPNTYKGKSNLFDHPCFFEMQAYLREHTYQENPLIITNSDLSGINAGGIYLPYVQGVEVLFQGAHLVGANFEGANLARAYFYGANLKRTNFLEANLSEAHLSGVSLARVNLVRANLERADLKGANFYGTDLTRANLKRADLRGANFRGVKLNEANFEGANLAKVNFSNTCLIGANLTNVFLAWACFYKTIVSEKEKAMIEEALNKIPQFIIK